MERPTRRIAHVRQHTTFRELSDGRWQAYFALLDLDVTGESEEAAFQALRDAIGKALEDDGLAERWQAWAVDHHSVEPIPDQEWEEMQEVVAEGEAASEGLAVLT